MKRHDTDITSLVFGLLFLGVVAMWALLEYGIMGIGGLEVAGPVLLVTIGGVGILASIGKLRRDHSE